MRQMNAPPEVVRWATPFGGDLFGAWDSCEHPEVMLSFALGLGTPIPDVITGAIEVFDMIAPKEVLEDPAIILSTSVINRYIFDYRNKFDPGELYSAIGTLGLLETDDEVMKSAYGSMSMLARATYLVGELNEVKDAQEALSISIGFIVKSRVDYLSKGCCVSDGDKHRTAMQLLYNSSHVARKYVPFSSVVGAVFFSMFGAEMGQG